ncbi:hypothetical protein L1049_003423 [Liquidambar formosana]|uniref:F-box associated beta-propeller type 3 domain-containing protein n=1 Tax=Liquidambar formosana TaxID=63359 RepID=A0AAP0N5G3_LIQFO
MKLPELKSSLPGPHVVFGGFEFDPNSNQYKVAEIFYYYGVPVRSEVHVYSLGDISWRPLGEAPYLIRRDTPYLEYRQVASKAFVNGALHWVGCRTARTIVSFDLANEVFDVFPLTEFVLRGGDYTLGMLEGTFR